VLPPGGGRRGAGPITRARRDYAHASRDADGADGANVHAIEAVIEALARRLGEVVGESDAERDDTEPPTNSASKHMERLGVDTATAPGMVAALSFGAGYGDTSGWGNDEGDDEDED